MNIVTLFLSMLGLVTVPACAIKTKTVPNAEVVVLIATDRPGSNTSAVAEQLTAAYKNAGLSVSLYDVTDFGADFYAPTAYGEKPAAFNQFNQAVLKAKVVVIVTPEYNATVPAPLTRVINLLSYPDSFEHKNFVIASVSIGQWGGVRAHTQLKKTLTDLHGVVIDANDLTLGEVHTIAENDPLYAQHAEKVVKLVRA